MMPSSHVRSSVFVIEALKTDANDMKDESIKKELWDNFNQSLMRRTLRGKGKKLLTSFFLMWYFVSRTFITKKDKSRGRAGCEPREKSESTEKINDANNMKDKGKVKN